MTAYTTLAALTAAVSIVLFATVPQSARIDLDPAGAIAAAPRRRPRLLLYRG